MVAPETVLLYNVYEYLKVFKRDYKFILIPVFKYI